MKTPSTYCCFLVVVSVEGELEAPELAPPEPALPLVPPDAEPLALGVLALPEVEPDALPLMPLLGDELELLDEAGGVVALGDELELLLEAPGAFGAELEPLLLEDEVPGRVASPDFCGDDGPRSQPVAASAIATAAATSVR
jgi:hypothetical protein